MSKGKTVWIVTTGWYSDYSVRAVCSTKERAIAVSAMCRDANPPQEVTLDEHYTQEKLGKKLYRCWCSKSNTNITPQQRDPDVDENEEHEASDGSEIVFWVWAHDEESAAKIANERRSRWITGADTYPRSTGANV